MRTPVQSDRLLSPAKPRGFSATAGVPNWVICTFRNTLLAYLCHYLNGLSLVRLGINFCRECSRMT
jgi:hypothetical protein